MSKTVDHRVVEMRFDNKQFEAGAKQTMNTLSRLKEALKLPDTTKALEGIDSATKNISLNGIAAGVEALNNRFSTLGIVGMRVIENITDGLMNKLHGAVSFVTDSIVSGGVKRAMNIENAHFQLQALLKDETKVQAVMSDAMESVDGTAYAYDEAAKAASQFAASGIQSGEEMLGALKGITGVAAMTNSSFEDVSRIFTTVAGNGRLMGDQLLQLSSRGLNAASTLADYFKEVRGQSDMTEASIRDMVSKGKISFKDFSDAMTWAFGDSAKRANETFTGAMSNMKSALARIGAGFISPLVEQNGELVQLFNALRIKINDVKTELVFDEQSSAISGLSEETNLLIDTVAKLTKEGTMDFSYFTDAIIGTSETLENYDEINERISKSFKSVKESGKLTSEALKEFNESGLHATSSLMAFINGVNSGSVKVSESTKKMVSELTNGTYVMESDIEKLVSSGKINFDIFSSAIVKSSNVMSKQADFMSNALKGVFDLVKKEGHLTEDIFNDLSSSGVNVGKSIKDYMNGVANGTIRATYSTKQAIEELRNNADLTASDILRLTREGKINFDIFQSAMENSFGNSRALSKQFTDSFQDMIHKVVIAVNELDMTKPMEVFYYGVESIKNVVKGLWSVLKPIGKAFADVFLDFNGDDVINFASAIETLTAKMRLSEKGSQNLHDAFEGIFNIAKLLVDVFFALFGAILPINKPVMEMGDGFLSIAGAIGRAITYFTNMIRSCTLLKKAFNVILSPISLSIDALTKLIKILKSFGASVIQLEGAQKLVNTIENAFVSFGKKATPYIEDFIDAAEEMFKSLFNIGDFNAEEVLSKISNALSNLASEIENFSFQRTVENFENFIQKVKDLAMANESFETFVTNIKKYAGKLKEAFSLDAITDKIEKVMSVFSRFSKWVKTTLGPAFEAFFSDFSLGNAIATGGAFAVLFAVIKAIKAIEKIGGALKSVVGLFDVAKGTLVAWQKDLKADAFLKISKGILALSIAITVLSFADMDNAWQATIMLGLIGVGLIAAVGYLMNVINKGKDINNQLGIFAKGLSKSMQNFTKSLKIKSIGSVIKSFGESIIMIAGSIIALGIMYTKNPDAMNKAVELVGKIGIAVVAIAAVSAIISKFINGKAMSSIGKSVLMTAGALALTVISINKLMKMEFPEDYESKLKILKEIIKILGELALVLGVSALISGGNQLPNMAKTIKSLVVLLVAIVGSLYALFKMQFPNDYEKKINILKGIFVGLGVLILAIGAAAKLSGGNGLKAAGTILALSAFLVVVVGSLMVLTIMPADKILNGVKALGAVIIALGVALAGAGQIEKGSNAAKTVLSMAIMVGVITAALSILSLIPFESLMKSTIALGLVLLTLSESFKNVAKVQSKKALPAIIAMIGSVTVIAVALYALSNQPWENMLSAAAAMSVTLLAFSKSFEMILGKRWSENNVKKIGTFLLMTLAVIPIGVAIGLLAQQPWEGLLTAAVAISGVALALTGIFFLLTKVNPDITSIVAFVAGAVALIPMAVALNMLAGQSWDSILPAIVALGAVSAILVAAMMVMSLAGPGILAGIVAFVAGAVAMIPIAVVMNMLTGLSWEQVATGLTTLAGALLIIGVAGLAGIVIAPGLLLLSVALIAFGAAITVVGVGLLAFTASLVASVALFETLFGSFGEAIGKIKDMGLNLIKGFINGIVDGFNSLISTVKEVGGGILETLAEVLGIHSPSWMTWLMGKFTDEGFANGLEDNAGIVNDSAESVFGGILDKIDTSALYGSGEGLAGGLADGIMSGEGGISSALSGLTSGLDMSSFGDLGNLGSMDFMNGLTDGLDMDGIQNALGGLTSGLDMSSFGDLGNLGSMDFMNGLTDGLDMTQIQESITSGLGEGFDTSQFFTTGEDSSGEFIEGFKTGMSDNVNDVAVEIANLLNESIGEQDFSQSGLDAIKKFLDSIIKAIKDKRPTFLTEGKESANNWITGIKNMYPVATTTGTELSNQPLLAMQLKVAEFLTKGTASANQFLQGFKNKYGEATSTGKTLANNALAGCQSLHSQFYQAGANGGQGFVDGLKSMMDASTAAGKAIGEAAYVAAKKALDEHSPSKKMGEVGENAGLGFINKLMLYVAKAANTGEKIGEAAIEGTNSGLEMLNDIGDFTLHPRIFMDDVYSSVREIEDLFNNAVNNIRADVISVNTQVQKAKYGTTEKSQDSIKTGYGNVTKNYNLNQYNTSPKALSRIEIYRQTKNLFSQFKEATDNV